MTKFYITALDSTPNLNTGAQDDHELTQEERERVIELLLGQDKVISLLYDQPDPKMQQQQQNGDFPHPLQEHYTGNEVAADQFGGQFA